MYEQEEMTWCDGYEQGICEGCDLSDKWLYEQKAKALGYYQPEEENA